MSCSYWEKIVSENLGQKLKLSGQFREGKYVNKTLHMRNWTHDSLIDSLTSVPLKDVMRKVQQRVNLDLEQ